MPIPEFVDNVLPEGVHDCTFEEIDERFGRFQHTDRRITLTTRLKTYLDAAQRSGIVKAVIVDGSYATAKDDPEDIDILIVIRDDIDLTQELRPNQRDVIDKKVVRRDYKFDAFSYKDGEKGLLDLIAWFSQVGVKHNEMTSRTHKGMVRVTL